MMASIRAAGVIGARSTEKPTGEHAEKMVGPGAWPETDESVFTDRASQLNEKLSALKGALDGWGSHQASIFNGPHVWSGVGAAAAGGKVEAHAQAMRNHEQQLRDAISWCNEAAGHIGTAKQSILENVNAGIDEINQTLDQASQSDQDPGAAIDAIVQRKYGENVATLGNAAKMLGFKGDAPAKRQLDVPGHTDPNRPADMHKLRTKCSWEESEGATERHTDLCRGRSATTFDARNTWQRVNKCNAGVGAERSGGSTT